MSLFIPSTLPTGLVLKVRKGKGNQRMSFKILNAVYFSRVIKQKYFLKRAS